jgi:soluble lytic murein transglycosylase-like protein
MRVLVLQILIASLAYSDANAFCFQDAGAAYGLNPGLLESIARVESGMKQNAINRNKNGTIDIGLMQINSFWIASAGLDKELLLKDACYNTKAGARILKGCIDRYDYSWKAVGCYNAVSDSKRKGYAWKVYKLLDREKPANRFASQNNSDGSKGETVKRDNMQLVFSIDHQSGMADQVPFSEKGGNIHE